MVADQALVRFEPSPWTNMTLGISNSQVIAFGSHHVKCINWTYSTPLDRSLPLLSSVLGSTSISPYSRCSRCSRFRLRELVY
jgi:hypothetical protein